MKKILAVLIAISMVATMAFATDFAFTVKTSGNVAAWDLEDPNVVNFLSNSTSASTTVTASVDGKAGVSATIASADVVVPTKDDDGNWTEKTAAADPSTDPSFAVKDVSKASGLLLTNTAVWVVPVDGVKLTFGALDTNAISLINEFGAVAGDGFDITITMIDNLTLDLGIQKDMATNAIPSFAAKAVYKVADPLTVAVTVGETAGNLTAGVALTGSVSVVSYAGAFEYAEGAMNAGEKLSVSLLDGLLSVAEIAEFRGLEATMTVPLTVTGGINYTGIDKLAVKLDAEFTATDILTQDTLKTVVTPSATFTDTIGDATWTLGVTAPITITDSVTAKVEVPYTVTLSF